MVCRFTWTSAYYTVVQYTPIQLAGSPTTSKQIKTVYKVQVFEYELETTILGLCISFNL